MRRNHAAKTVLVRQKWKDAKTKKQSRMAKISEPS
jgi:hypothetical protein